MTETYVTASRAAGQQASWTAAEWAAFHVGHAEASASMLGTWHGLAGIRPFGNVNTAPGQRRLMNALGLTGPEMPRTSAEYRAMLAGAYTRAYDRAGSTS